MSDRLMTLAGYGNEIMKLAWMKEKMERDPLLFQYLNAVIFQMQSKFHA